MERELIPGSKWMGMEGCRSHELNPFWTIELLALKIICKADFYTRLLTAFTAAELLFPYQSKVKKLTFSEGGGGWERNEMALISWT